jgi:hypothetical protein
MKFFILYTAIMGTNLSVFAMYTFIDMHIFVHKIENYSYSNPIFKSFLNIWTMTTVFSIPVGFIIYLWALVYESVLQCTC